MQSAPKSVENLPLYAAAFGLNHKDVMFTVPFYFSTYSIPWLGMVSILHTSLDERGKVVHG